MFKLKSDDFVIFLTCQEGRQTISRTKIEENPRKMAKKLRKSRSIIQENLNQVDKVNRTGVWFCEILLRKINTGKEEGKRGKEVWKKERGKPESVV